jgi:DnaJ-class molecular chaperone
VSDDDPNICEWCLGYGEIRTSPIGMYPVMLGGRGSTECLDCQGTGKADRD